MLWSPCEFYFSNTSYNTMTEDDEEAPNYLHLPTGVDNVEVYQTVKSLEEALPLDEMTIEEKVFQFLRDGASVDDIQTIILQEQPETVGELDQIRAEFPTGVGHAEVFELVQRLSDSLPLRQDMIEEKVAEFLSEGVAVDDIQTLVLRADPQTADELERIRTEPLQEFTHLEIQTMAEELSDETGLETAKTKNELYSLIEHSVPLPEIKKAIRRKARHNQR